MNNSQASTSLKISSKFPEGYGDFSIQSSDDVVYYFPGAILSYISCVFRDMFKSAGSDERAKASETPLKITEPIAILEVFLTHLDPEQLTPLIDPDTIEGLLQMADKYQTSKILRWFEREASMVHGNIDSPGKPFMIAHPLITSSLACRFDLENIGRAALRELSGCAAQMVYDHTTYLDPRIYRELYVLRKRRVDRYVDWIRTLSGWTGEDLGCGHCTNHRGRWIWRMMRDVQNAPTWVTFTAAYEVGRGKKCSTCGSICFDKFILGWKGEAEVNEAILPEWPLKKQADS
jgi:hypothetical protein